MCASLVKTYMQEPKSQKFIVFGISVSSLMQNKRWGARTCVWQKPVCIYQLQHLSAVECMRITSLCHFRTCNPFISRPTYHVCDGWLVGWGITALLTQNRIGHIVPVSL